MSAPNKMAGHPGSLREYLGFGFGFRLSTLKSHYCLIPIVVIIGGACCAAAGHLIHLTKSPDVRFARSKGPAHESVGPRHMYKYRITKPELYRPIAELEELKDAVKVGPTPKEK